MMLWIIFIQDITSIDWPCTNMLSLRVAAYLFLLFSMRRMSPAPGNLLIETEERMAGQSQGSDYNIVNKESCYKPSSQACQYHCANPHLSGVRTFAGDCSSGPDWAQCDCRHSQGGPTTPGGSVIGRVWINIDTDACHLYFQMFSSQTQTHTQQN